MVDGTGWRLLVLGGLAVILGAALVAGPGAIPPASSGEPSAGTPAPTPVFTPTTEPATEPTAEPTTESATVTPTAAIPTDRTVVTFQDQNGTDLGQLDVRVADTQEERYTGLSNTDSLGPDEGMLFVHPQEGEYAYVMRDMAFPIDIVFVGADGRITAIHHADIEPPPLTRYRGRGVWVVETPHDWTTDHGVSVGEQVTVDRTPP